MEMEEVVTEVRYMEGLELGLPRGTLILEHREATAQEVEAGAPGQMVIKVILPRQSSFLQIGNKDYLLSYRRIPLCRSYMTFLH